MRPKTPKRPTRPKASESDYIIPKPVSPDSESALDDDATSFMAITPKVAKNPTAPVSTHRCRHQLVLVHQILRHNRLYLPDMVHHLHHLKL